ncbi:MAG: HAD family phosphatase [Lachnospiraceae bacterium]|nr:HAD family phosphatase [Lachnospiraceae bacterium]
MLENISAVIFDLDGTLIDSMWMWRTIDLEFLGARGIELPDDLQESVAGMSFSETAVYFKERFGLKEDTDEIKRIWNEMAMDIYTHRVPFKPGAREFLNRIKAMGLKTGIATSNSIELLTAVLEALGVRPLFDEIHTSCEVERGKPCPDIYLLTAQRLGVEPSRCLVFEDIIQGIEAGHAAGMKVCAVFDDFSKNDNEAKRAAADFYIEHYDEVI